MEPTPSLDTSRPSPVRLWSFLLVVVGAFLAGVGAVQTWVTVGIANQSQLDTATKGTDTWQGKVVLACALVLLVGVLASRAVRGRVRTAVGVIVSAAGIVAAAVAGAFLATASSTYSAVDNDALVHALATATGTTTQQVRDQACAKLGCSTTIGAGPWLALAGGILGLLGGILVLAWASRLARASDAKEPAEDATPTGSDTA